MPWLLLLLTDPCTSWHHLCQQGLLASDSNLCLQPPKEDKSQTFHYRITADSYKWYQLIPCLLLFFCHNKRAPVMSKQYFLPRSHHIMWMQTFVTNNETAQCPNQICKVRLWEQTQSCENVMGTSVEELCQKGILLALIPASHLLKMNSIKVLHKAQSSGSQVVTLLEKSLHPKREPGAVSILPHIFSGSLLGSCYTTAWVWSWAVQDPLQQTLPSLCSCRAWNIF